MGCSVNLAMFAVPVPEPTQSDRKPPPKLMEFSLAHNTPLVKFIASQGDKT